MKNICECPKRKTVCSFILVVLVAVLFRSLLFEPFHIPSGSMKSTLLVGDYIFVNKYAYGYSRYSFPFAPKIFKGRIFYHRPRAGDVVVFRPVGKEGINYIKRIIGLPGDKVQLIDGDLYINDKKMKYEKITDFVDIDRNDNKAVVPRYEETIYNGRKYEILKLDGHFNDNTNNTQMYTVPQDHFFVLGDNRDNSQDSRYIGFVPMENLVGRAEIVALSFKSWLPPKLRLDRILHKV
ncbi:MAG: signal peptidase I [Candidatus Mesenet longicola]|uniref:Signal peptidase I n=1 Tax=Candidatus Mesenet longicola TaxID=1892558 RepID=A0A8J3HS37_9RICK|nr:MAG: signal peptidase I [Candidatus Mesenet longicola]GHM59258.1 MAG: signal peptidase I [Candidatus Mesenet longicola]